MKFKRIISYITSIALLLTFIGCSEKKEDTKVQKDTITVIVPKLGGKLIRGAILEEAKKFEEKTGTRIRVVTPSWIDTINKINESLNDPKINFDMFVIITSWGGSLLGENQVAVVPDWVKKRIDWDDVLPVYKNNILTWGNKTYALPYDGDCINLYYRKDVFKNKNNQKNFLKEFGYKLTPPKTWKNYEDIAKFFNGWDWDGDGKVEYGIAGSRLKGYGSVLQFFTRAAAYAKHPDDKAYYFDIDTMKARINNEGFIKALEDYISVMKYGPKEILNFSPSDVRKSFISGDVVMAIDWANMGTMAANSEISVVRDKVGYAELPGYDKVFNSKTNSWDNIYNSPSSISGNWTILVNKNSKQQKLAFEFAAHMTSKKLTSKLITLGWTGVNPSRYSHFKDLSAWADSGFSQSSAKEYLGVISKSLSNKNVMIDIRIPGSSQYYDTLSYGINLALKGEVSPSEALNSVVIKWEGITESLNRDNQIRLYKKSLNK